ncbi:hypothetical protein E2542_SST17509 [Spatholobus suberectus]|nr:hypothetical protein E2542_SST17509 [Spatholobus suberectus]
MPRSPGHIRAFGWWWTTDEKISQKMYHIMNDESYKGKGEHVMQQVVIFFGSVAKPIVGSNLNMPSNQWDDLSNRRLLIVDPSQVQYESMDCGGAYFSLQEALSSKPCPILNRLSTEWELRKVIERALPLSQATAMLLELQTCSNSGPSLNITVTSLGSCRKGCLYRIPLLRGNTMTLA